MCALHKTGLDLNRLNLCDANVSPLQIALKSHNLELIHTLHTLGAQLNTESEYNAVYNMFTCPTIHLITFTPETLFDELRKSFPNLDCRRIVDSVSYIYQLYLWVKNKRRCSKSCFFVRPLLIGNVFFADIEKVSIFPLKWQRS